MSSFKRRSILMMAAGPLLLAGCGFTPVYGPNGSGHRLHGQIAVDAPEDSDGFELVRQLEYRLGQPGLPRYGLSLGLITTEEGVALTSDNRTTRREVIGTATYALRDLDSKAVVISGKVDSFTGYSTTGSTVSELAAARDARRRLMVILADLITNRLLARAGDLPA
ncbi:LPS assembly lipoprotein LptE [Cognatishimia sp. WU-CL00825]|uniref:LPS assembly lipoprotein LptE n=1 Tax=Cognatishimia sp. WU-CL00825 TaxID=3127658 RepID=UPI003104D220